ncbi:ATP-binding protein [Gloeocapsa sp. PCC 73106]|uniref:ATP-binding protein n=1 Tax=Gloeocapsa sp. PCC 73106 TaxID=102232 RepID=UPI000555E8B6|nr:ATP-binding protein [Gloeocapsa sp. PCC 73106]
MSLYQIVAGFDSLEQILSVSPTTLEGLVSSLIDLLIEEQIETTVWVKPATSWVQDIERYQNLGKVNQIYWCQTFEGNPLISTKSAKYSLVSLKLLATRDLEREFFLAIISEELSLLIFAQQQPVSTMPNKLARRNSLVQLKLFCTVEISLIEKFLTGVIQFTENNLLEPPSLAVIDSFNSTLLLKLLLKQITQTENIALESSVSTTNKRQAGSTAQSLVFQKEFIDQFSRELRPPLTNMKTAICLLESKYLKVSQRQRYLELLHREWERQNCLLTGLLELVQLDHLSSQQQYQSADIKNILPGIIGTYLPIAQEQNIQLGYRFPHDLPSVSCSPLWLKQIILNLLNNNLKFTPSGGKVFVEAYQTQTGVEMSFIDTGIGINTSELSKIFDSFYRGRNPQGEENKGAGLGLTVVKQLLERCDGSINVSSQVNKGSVFKVLFKLA